MSFARTLLAVLALGLLGWFDWKRLAVSAVHYAPAFPFGVRVVRVWIWLCLTFWTWQLLSEYELTERGN